MNIAFHGRYIWLLVVAFALTCSARAFNPIEWAKVPRGLLPNARRSAVHDVEVKLPVLHMDNILGQVSDVLPQIDLKEVEKGFSEFAHNIAKAEQALEKALAKGSFDLGHFSEAFVKEFEKRGLEFQQELLETTTLTEEDDVNFAELERSLDNILDKVQEVFVDVAGALQVDQIHSEKIFDEIRSPLKHLIVVTAKTIERHPCLLELALYLAVRPLPIAGWLISPIMTLLGFAAKGPVKGSFASSVQRKVYKDGVPKDSWFSKAQSAGMKGEGPPVLGTVLELSALGLILAQCA